MSADGKTLLTWRGVFCLRQDGSEYFLGPGKLVFDPRIGYLKLYDARSRVRLSVKLSAVHSLGSDQVATNCPYSFKVSVGDNIVEVVMTADGEECANLHRFLMAKIDLSSVKQKENPSKYTDKEKPSANNSGGSSVSDSRAKSRTRAAEIVAWIFDV